MHRRLLQPVQNEEPVCSLSTVGLRLSKDSGRLAGDGNQGCRLAARRRTAKITASATSMAAGMSPTLA